MSLLSDTGILRHMALGSVVISPFRSERLNTDSYDLELGPFFWRYTAMDNRLPSVMKRGEGFKPVDARAEGGLWLEAGERVLGHSVEVVGGRVADGRAVTTSLHATSTAARHALSACLCAGWGDVGFVNIFVFEINNLSKDRMWLPVGAVIAQIAFTEVEPPQKAYDQRGGQYQGVDSQKTAEEIRAAWTPESMLPGPLKVREGWREFWPSSPLPVNEEVTCQYCRTVFVTSSDVVGACPRCKGPGRRVQ